MVCKRCFKFHQNFVKLELINQNKSNQSETFSKETGLPGLFIESKIFSLALQIKKLQRFQMWQIYLDHPVLESSDEKQTQTLFKLQAVFPSTKILIQIYFNINAVAYIDCPCSKNFLAFCRFQLIKQAGIRNIAHNEITTNSSRH